MNVKTVKLNRKYNLGNYEQAEIGLEAELTEQEGASAADVQKAMKDLDKLFPHPVLTELYMDLPKQEPIPEPEKKEPPKQEPEKPSLEAIDWVEGGETDKGPYQKSASKPIDYYNVKKAIEDKGKPIYVDGFIVWYMDKDDCLARRRK